VTAGATPLCFVRGRADAEDKTGRPSEWLGGDVCRRRGLALAFDRINL